MTASLVARTMTPYSAVGAKTTSLAVLATTPLTAAKAMMFSTAVKTMTT